MSKFNFFLKNKNHVFAALWQKLAASYCFVEIPG